MIAWIVFAAFVAVAMLAACSGSIPGLRILTGAEESTPLGCRDNRDWEPLFTDHQHEPSAQEPS